MTNAEAIQTLKLMLSQVEWDYPMEYSAAIDEAIKALEAQEWIPVSERLPKVAHSVLFSRRSMDTSEGCLQADGKWWQYRWNEILNADQVTAWMPLPEPYQEDA